MPIIFAVFNLIFYAVLILLVSAIAFVAVSVLWGRGAVYVPADRRVVRKMIELAKVEPGDKAVDLGSGDGRIVIALARAGAETHGFEINPFLVWLARKKIRQAGLSQKAFIHWKSFWGQNLAKYNVITVYGVDYIMRRLEKKLEKELALKSRRESYNNTRVVSYLFEFPQKKRLDQRKSVYLYKF
jgi:hypothetical protein